MGRVTTIGWTESSVTTKKDFGAGTHMDITKSLGLAMQAGDITLPHDLFDFDLTQVLPKLSVLPSIPSYVKKTPCLDQKANPLQKYELLSEECYRQSY